MTCIYLALGSNLGNREEHLRSGIRGLASRGTDIVRCASVYSTQPLEVLDQPWFLNTVLEANTDLSPDALMRACLDIEEQSCRIREVSKGPRTLDIDIIFYGTEIIRTPALTIPHPRLAMRRFVLIPLAEIVPTFIDPVSGKSIRELLEHCPDEGEVVRAGRL